MPTVSSAQVCSLPLSKSMLLLHSAQFSQRDHQNHAVFTDCSESEESESDRTSDLDSVEYQSHAAPIHCSGSEELCTDVESHRESETSNSLSDDEYSEWNAQSGMVEDPFADTLSKFADPHSAFASDPNGSAINITTEFTTNKEEAKGPWVVLAYFFHGFGWLPCLARLIYDRRVIF